MGPQVGGNGERSDEGDTGDTMSETETETLTDDEMEAAPDEGSPSEPDATPDAEPAEQIEGADDGDDDDDDASDDDAGDGFQEDAAPPSDDQAIERLHKQIENANRAHVAKIGRIMGDDATALIPCPVCMDFTAGLIFPPEVAPIPQPVQERMKQLLGLNSWEDTPNAPWAQQCPDCKGHGEVKTGSFVLGKETTRCLNCGGDGWKNTRQGSNGTIDTPAIPSETGPTVYGQELAQDPDVQHLREKGYTVIPPMHVTNA
jgi:hypothetical protein